MLAPACFNLFINKAFQHRKRSDIRLDDLYLIIFCRCGEILLSSNLEKAVDKNYDSNYLLSSCKNCLTSWSQDLRQFVQATFSLAGINGIMYCLSQYPYCLDLNINSTKVPRSDYYSIGELDGRT